MNFIDNWVQKRYHKMCRNSAIMSSSEATVKEGRDGLRSGGMTFTIYNANGGHILEFTSYDHKTDQRVNGLHIVTHEQNLGEQIGHAYTLEMIKR